MGDRWSFYCVLNGVGEAIVEAKVITNPDAMKKTFGKMPRSRIALKAGTHSPWVNRTLAEAVKAQDELAALGLDSRLARQKNTPYPGKRKHQT